MTTPPKNCLQLSLCDLLAVDYWLLLVVFLLHQPTLVSVARSGGAGGGGERVRERER